MSSATEILKKVANHGELSIYEALLLSKKKFNDHRDQYTLSLLIEEGYLGITIKNCPPEGAEEMREYMLATHLHMYTIKPNSDGEIKYNGITARGYIDPHKQSIFIKAKGLLYIAELREKKFERAVAFITGFAAAFLAQYLATIAITPPS